MTISVPDGYSITNIVFTASANNYAVKGTTDLGTLSVSNATSTWSGNAQKIVLTSSATCRLQKMVFTYTAPAAAVERVEINYDFKTAEVALTCPTAGATIFYGFAADAMTNQYSAPFKITENCTIFAYAQLGSDESRTSELSVALPYTTFKELIDDASDKDQVNLLGNFQVLYQSGDYLILTDGSTNLVLYRVSEEYTVGTKISVISASYAPYHGLPELTDITLIEEGGNGAEYNVTELISIDDVTVDSHLMNEVALLGCTISRDLANITIHGATLPINNLFGIELTQGDDFKVTGFFWVRDKTLQLVPVAAESGFAVPTVRTPVISPNHRELMPGDDITITCATSNVEIHYTTDGEDPTEDSPVYNGPIDFPEDAVDFTVKARAYYTGSDVSMFESPVATRQYHIFDASCNVITADNHEDGGNSYLPAHTCTIDRVDYQMVGMHNSTQGIQMNNNSSRFCYLIQTSDNKGFVVGDGIEWVLSSISLNYHDSNSKIEFNVRGSNTPFTASTTETSNNTSDKASIEETGEFVGTISASKPSVDFTKNYRYFALYPTKTGVVYLDDITINYRRVQDSPRTKLTGAYLEADENSVQEQFEMFVGAYTKDGDELDLTGNVTLAVKDANGKVLAESSEFYYDVDGYLATVMIKEAGRYTVTMSWTGDLNYEDGSLSTVLNVYSPVLITDNNSGVVCSSNATIQEASEATKGHAVLVFPAGQRDHKITLSNLAGAKIHYRVTEVSVAPTANAPKQAANKAPQGFTEHTGGEITLSGEHGVLALVTEKNGVVSPIEETYYTNDIDKLDEVTTGVAEVEINNGEAVYYDLSGLRVAADKLKAGIYVRVAGQKLTKVLVK